MVFSTVESLLRFRLTVLFEAVDQPDYTDYIFMTSKPISQFALLTAFYKVHSHIQWENFLIWSEEKNEEL